MLKKYHLYTLLYLLIPLLVAVKLSTRFFKCFLGRILSFFVFTAIIFFILSEISWHIVFWWNVKRRCRR